MFSLYISIAIIIHYKEQIVTCQDKIVPQLITQISLDDLGEVKKLIEKARNIKNNIPYSMLIKISKCGVFNLETIDSLIKSLEKQACLAVLPCEIVHRAYPEVNICPCLKKNCP